MSPRAGPRGHGVEKLPPEGLDGLGVPSEVHPVGQQDGGYAISRVGPHGRARKAVVPKGLRR